MFLLGLLLVVLGALAVIGAVTTLEGSAALLGFDDVSAMAVFLVGLGAGVAVLWGFSLAKLGTKRTMAHRREQKRLTELSEQLDQVEHDRRRGIDQDRPTL